MTRKKATNIFLCIGIIAVVIMLLTFDIPYAQIWKNLHRAGWWFVAVVLIWIPIYMINAWSWMVIIKGNDKKCAVPYFQILKYTISGYALNYITPVGLLGGEPYRIMELSKYYNIDRASSAVILYAMMHIFSHFFFWAFSIVLFVALKFEMITPLTGIFLLIVSAFISAGIYLFMKGYRKGFAMKTLRLFIHWPFIGTKVARFMVSKEATIHKIDERIAALHKQDKRSFYLSLSLEFLARILGCLEIWFIFMILSNNVSFTNCILIQAFTSLFANLFFFMPMEMGTREGGFAISVGSLAMSGAFGVLAGLLTRVRELIWIMVGLVLIKVNNK